MAYNSGKSFWENIKDAYDSYYANELSKDEYEQQQRKQFPEDVKSGKYIFGDGEGLFHNLGELYGKVLGTAGDLANEVVSQYGNGFFDTEVGQTITSTANQVAQTGKHLLHVLPVLNEPSYAGSGASAHAIDYGNYAPGAQMFGMDRETAYQEFMANTAHQREVADLRAAGLNPVLGISGSGASVVSGNAAGASSAQKGLNSDALVDVIGATAGLLTTIFTKKPAYGYMVKNVITSGGDLLKK